MPDRTTGLWIGPRKAARLLDVSRATLPRVVEEGRVTTRRVPPNRVQYLRADVERLAREWVVPARAPSGDEP